MGAQDRTEKVLRDIHILFSKAESFEGSKKKVIVDKSEVMELLKELNSCMYDMQEEYELTVASRDKANRLNKKEGEDIIFDAKKNADDIYAASIMYTDNALHNIRDIMKDAEDQMERILSETKQRIRQEENQVRANQSDLKGNLQGLIDTEKYLRLIDDENRRLAKEKEMKKDKKAGRYQAEEEEKRYADVVPEIKINTDYFRAQGIPLDEEDAKENDSANEAEEIDIEKLSAELDAEYFDWKDGND